MNAFTERGALRRYLRPSYVYIQGSEPDAAYVLKYGRIETSSASDAGHEMIHTIHQPGEPFGFGELLLREPRTHSARVLQDAEVWILGRDRFLAMLGSKPELVLALFGSALDRFLRHEELLTRSSGGSARRRVEAALAFLSVGSRRRSDRGNYLALELTHEEIARVCDLSRQTVTEVLDELQSLGIVELRRRAVIVRDPALLHGSPAGRSTGRSVGQRQRSKP